MNGRPDLLTLSQAVPPASQPTVRKFLYCLEQAAEQGKPDITRAIAEWRQHHYGYNHKVRRRGDGVDAV